MLCLYHQSINQFKYVCISTEKQDLSSRIIKLQVNVKNDDEFSNNLNRFKKGISIYFLNKNKVILCDCFSIL